MTGAAGNNRIKELQIILLYRLLLNRDPESRDIVRFYAHWELHEIIKALAASEEFRASFDQRALDVENSTSSDLLSVDSSTRGSELHPRIMTETGAVVFCSSDGTLTSWPQDNLADNLKQSLAESVLAECELLKFSNGRYAFRRGLVFLSADPITGEVGFRAEKVGKYEMFEIEGAMCSGTFTFIPGQYGTDYNISQIFQPEEENLKLPSGISADEERWFDNFDSTFYPLRAGARRVPENALFFGANKLVSAKEGAAGSIFDRTGFYHNRWFMSLGRDARAIVPTTDSFAVNLSEKLELSGSYSLAFDGNSWNYYHFLFESLLSLFYMHERGVREIPIVFSKDKLPSWQTKYLQIMDINEYLVIDGSKHELVQVEFGYWLRSREMFDISSAMLHRFKSHILSRLVSTVSARRRIYIRRTGSRSISNAHELEGLLIKLGFDVIVPEHMTLAEQIKSFSGASYIIGAHGAGLSNILYCATGSQVLELVADTDPRNCFWYLCEKLGLKYRFLRCRAENYLSGTFEVNLLDIAKMLEVDVAMGYPSAT